MKKITLLLAALAVALSSFGQFSIGSNAYLGSYDCETKTFTQGGHDTQIDEFNPRSFTLAILVEYQPWLDYCAANPTATLLLNATRQNDGFPVYPNAGGSFTDGTQFPAFTRVDDAVDAFGPVEGIVFYICGFDLGEIPAAAQAQIDVAAVRHIQTNFVLALENVDDRIAEVPSNWPKPGDWMNYAEDWTQGRAVYAYLGGIDQPAGSGENHTVATTEVADCSDCGPASLKQAAADAECGEPTGFFNLLGQSLGKDTSATGVFIATYANCPAKKIVVK